jgi:hypothetical protein
MIPERGHQLFPGTVICAVVISTEANKFLANPNLLRLLVTLPLSTWQYERISSFLFDMRMLITLLSLGSVTRSALSNLLCTDPSFSSNSAKLWREIFAQNKWVCTCSLEIIRKKAGWSATQITCLPACFGIMVTICTTFLQILKVYLFFTKFSYRLHTIVRTEKELLHEIWFTLNFPCIGKYFCGFWMVVTEHFNIRRRGIRPQYLAAHRNTLTPNKCFLMQECRLLGCGAVWVLLEPTFQRYMTPQSSRWKEDLHGATAQTAVFNSIQFNSLCAESTATRPITDTAQYRYT